MKKLTLLLSIFILSCAHQSPLARNPSSESSGILAEDSDSQNPMEDLTGLYDNPEHAPIFDIIRQAKSSIDVEIYEMYDVTFLKLLLAKANKKVRVRIVKDPTPVGGDNCHLFTNSSKPIAKSDMDACKLQESLKQKAQIVPFNKKTLCSGGSCFEHGKMIIVDGKHALLSSGNFNDSNLCDPSPSLKTCNRDYSYITRDPEVISALKEIFEKDLAGKTYDVSNILKTGTLQNKITVSPYSKAPLIALVNGAKHHLQIENQYMKDEDWNNAIKAAAARGVEVTVQVADPGTFGSIKDSNEEDLCKLFGDLEKSKVTVRFFTSEMKFGKEDGYLHAKAVVVDGEVAWIGSVNGSTESLDRNREFGIFFSNPTRVTFLSKILAQDFTHPKSVGWRQEINCH